MGFSGGVYPLVRDAWARARARGSSTIPHARARSMLFTPCSTGPGHGKRRCLCRGAEPCRLAQRSVLITMLLSCAWDSWGDRKTPMAMDPGRGGIRIEAGERTFPRLAYRATPRAPPNRPFVSIWCWSETQSFF